MGRVSRGCLILGRAVVTLEGDGPGPMLVAVARWRASEASIEESPVRPVGLGVLLGTPSHSRATAAVAGGSNGSPGSMPTVQRTAAVSSSLILAPVARSCLAPESLCLPRPNCAVRRVRGARQESLTVYGTHPAGWNTSVRLWCGGEQVASVCRRNRGQQRDAHGHPNASRCWKGRVTGKCGLFPDNEVLDGATNVASWKPENTCDRRHRGRRMGEAGGAVRCQGSVWSPPEQWILDECGKLVGCTQTQAMRLHEPILARPCAHLYRTTWSVTPTRRDCD